jgi:hypothetical protein
MYMYVTVRGLMNIMNVYVCALVCMCFSFMFVFFFIFVYIYMRMHVRMFVGNDM